MTGQSIGYGISEHWRRVILACEDPQIDTESALALIAATRETLQKAGCSALEEHHALSVLRDLLPALTGGHPLCKQFIELLDLELECN
jgi:hypothetical protein